MLSISKLTMSSACVMTRYHTRLFDPKFDINKREEAILVSLPWRRITSQTSSEIPVALSANFAIILPTATCGFIREIYLLFLTVPHALNMASIMLDGKKLSDFRVVDLRQELEKRGLEKSGVKAVLIERLQNVSWGRLWENGVRNHPISKLTDH